MSQTINILKGVGIFSVVVFYVIGARGVSIFMLPLFFVLSGYLCKGYVPWRSFVRDKCSRLIIPYIFYGVAFMLLGYILHGSYPFRSGLHNLLIGGQTLQGDYGTFWFVNVLFVSLLLFNALLLMGHKRIVMPLTCGIMLTMAMLINNRDISIPWSLQTVPLALSYMCVGYMVRQIVKPIDLDAIVHKIPKWVSICGLLLVILLALFLPKSMEMDIKYDMYGVSVFSWILSIVATAILVFSVPVLNLWGGVKFDILKFMGQNSFGIMLLHQYIHFNIYGGHNVYLQFVIVCVIVVVIDYLISLSKYAPFFGCYSNNKYYGFSKIF